MIALVLGTGPCPYVYVYVLLGALAVPYQYTVYKLYNMSKRPEQINVEQGYISVVSGPFVKCLWGWAKRFPSTLTW